MFFKSKKADDLDRNIQRQRWVNIKRTDYLFRKLQREKTARSEAEQLLEEKSRELYDAKQRVLEANQNLEKLVEERTKQLEKANHEINEVFEQANAAMMNVDLSGRITKWNKQCETLTGYNKTDVESMTLHDVPFVKNTSKEAVGRAFQDALEGEETSNVRITLLNKAGAEIYISLNTNPRRDSQGNIVGAIGLGRDITELTKLHAQQEKERKEAQAQIMHASKLATLGEMATSVAHELNQPLNVIRMAAWNLRHKAGANKCTPEYLHEKLERIEEQTTRASSVIDHMRTFGREAKETFEPVDPRIAVRNAVELIGEQLNGSGTKVVTEFPEDCPLVQGHLIQLEQVLLNLLSNAHDAIRNCDTAGAIKLCVFADSSDIHITCEDNGCGIPEPVMSRIFEPFYTTKSMGQGTGLGLSVSYGIISDMNGGITVESTTAGTRFDISLPCVS